MLSTLSANLSMKRETIGTIEQDQQCLNHMKLHIIEFKLKRALAQERCIKQSRPSFLSNS